MCEFFKNLELSDITNIAQAIIAAFSAWFLYKTFNAQKETDQRNLELAKLEKNAKRAEYIPNFSVRFKPSLFPSESDGAGGSIVNYQLDGHIHLFIGLKVLNNPIQLIDHENDVIDLIPMHLETSYYSKNQTNYFLPDNEIEFGYLINHKFAFENAYTHSEIEARVNSLNIETHVYFKDVIGNKYMIAINIRGTSQVYLGNLVLLEDERSSD